MDLGKAINIIREETGLSRKVMAEKLGCTASALWKIETGKSIPKPSTVRKFCEVTCTPLAYFYNRAFTAEDFRMNPNGTMIDGTPIYQDGCGRIFPV